MMDRPDIAQLHRGPIWWLRSYAFMLRFDLSSQRAWLPFATAMQVLMGAGMAVIYGFYVPHLSTAGALYLVTGAPALALIPLGMVFIPGVIGQQRTAGTFDFLWSLPAPRAAGIASTLTIATLLAVPGICAMRMAVWRYGVGLSISPMVVPAFLLTALMAASVGIGLGYLIRNPVVTNVITNVLIIGTLLFSPIAFPKSQFPFWLASVHEILPLYHMGVVVRASLTAGLVTDVSLPNLVLTVWALAGWLAAGCVVARRG